MSGFLVCYSSCSRNLNSWISGIGGRKRIVCIASNFFSKCSSTHLLYFSQFADELKTKVSPAFKQAVMEPHSLNSMDFCPTNCHINLMEVSYPKSTTSAGRSFSIRIGRKPSIIGLDPEQGENQLSSCTDFICIKSCGFPLLSKVKYKFQGNIVLPVPFLSP